MSNLIRAAMLNVHYCPLYKHVYCQLIDSESTLLIVEETVSSC